MRSRSATLLAVAVVCVTIAWAEWTPEVRVTGDNGSSRSFCINNGRSLVFGPDGFGHLVWDGQGIGCNRYNPLSGWTSDYQVSQGGVDPCIALDADGSTIHVAYDNSALCYQNCTRSTDGGDEWSPVETLNTSLPWNPSMASVPEDPNHLVACLRWEYTSKRRTSYAIAFFECIDGVWAPECRLDSAVSSSRIVYPAIAVAPSGDVFIAYTNSSGQGVFVKTRHNGAWGTTVNATPSLSSNWITGHAIEVNPYTGNPHVVFSCRIVTVISKKVSDTTWAVYHTYRNSEGVWQTPELVSVPQHLGYYLAFWHGATMGFTTDGASYVAWSERSPVTSHGVKYGYCSAEGEAWSNPAWLTSDTSASYSDRYPFVAVDEYGDAVHVAWCRLYADGHSEIWWRRGSLGGGGGGQGQSTALPQAEIELFPDPARAGRVAVRYSLPRSGQMTVTLVDISGRVVRTQEVAAGLTGTVGVDVTSLSAGVYVARLVAGDLDVSQPLVIAR